MKERGALVGSLLAGLLASACCIGPLVLGVLGLSSLGLGAALAPLRPWFLGVTAAFLAVGFYFPYRPQRAEVCASGQACAKPVSRRNQRIGLWVVTAAAVALASYPSWGARLTTSHASVRTIPAANSVVVLDVHGMTCSACAGEIEGELRKVPGVVRADVSYERRRAEIRLSAARSNVQPLIAAVEKAGYRATTFSAGKGDAPVSKTRQTATSVSDGRAELLFKAVLQYRSESEADAVVPAEGHEGAYLGSGDGTVTGDRLRGTIRWSAWAGNCLYPLIRKGQKVPDELHLCTFNPGGFIETDDGARIRIDARGYGLRSAERYRVSATLAFGTDDARYAWLTKVLGLMEGDFDENAGRATWSVYVPEGAHN